MFEELEGKEIAIVGLGGSYSDYVKARINSKSYDEVWGINSIGAIVHVDRTFMMDPASRFLDGAKAGTQTGIAAEFLLDTANKGPIYSCCLDDRVPEIIEYPLSEVIQELGYAYFNNTVAYALAFAIAAKVEKIHLFGIDFSYKKNLYFAEAGRACCEFWAAIALTRGIVVRTADTSSFLDTNVPLNEKLYGYHRLDDPLVQYIEEDKLVIIPESEHKPKEQEHLEGPEPLDGMEPVLLGRHDIKGVTYSV
jgi:hypothetical protein|tara:strand:+ start:1191 stop:1943 length:753 start_codon:yes stop_codon:yes gene_type:complete